MRVKLRDDFHKDSITVNGYTISKSQVSNIPDKYFSRLQKKTRGLVIMNKTTSKKPNYSKMLKNELASHAKKEGVVVKNSMTKADIIKELQKNE